MLTTPLVEAFQSVARLTRDEIFFEPQKNPISAIPHSKIAAPGWVGSNWEVGFDLFVGINPGGGSDAYKINSSDNTLYHSFERFRQALPQDADERFREMSLLYLKAQQSYKLARLLDAVLEATGRAYAQSAFINLVPFRTRGNAEPSGAEKRRAWFAGVEREVQELRPRRLFALGQKAARFLSSIPLKEHSTLIYIARTNGDNYIATNALSTIASL